MSDQPRHCAGCGGWVSHGPNDEGHECFGLAEAGRSADSLDVERLEQAMHIVDDEVQFMHRDAAQHRDVMAKRIAREYAHLTTDEPEGDGR